MDDPISREDAINAIYHHFPGMTMRECTMVLHEVPSAEPERKKGKWTVTSLFIKCSECGEAFMLIPQNYCPNCGAKMVEEKENE